MLFSYTETRAVRRELFVILRPQIINGNEDDALIYQEFRESFEALAAVLSEMWN